MTISKALGEMFRNTNHYMHFIIVTGFINSVPDMPDIQQA